MTYSLRGMIHCIEIGVNRVEHLSAILAIPLSVLSFRSTDSDRIPYYHGRTNASLYELRVKWPFSWLRDIWEWAYCSNSLVSGLALKLYELSFLSLVLDWGKWIELTDGTSELTGIISQVVLFDFDLIEVNSAGRLPKNLLWLCLVNGSWIP